MRYSNELFESGVQDSLVRLVCLMEKKKLKTEKESCFEINAWVVLEKSMLKKSGFYRNPLHHDTDTAR